MITFRRLLPAAVLLLSAQACVVSMDDLQPKTDEMCWQLEGFDTKACGPKCVSLFNAATGCGDRSCQACPPGPPNTVAVCDSFQGCAYLCDVSFADCNGDLGFGYLGDGCELDLWADPYNCGACGRTCFTRCEAGACLADLSSNVELDVFPSVPRGMLNYAGDAWFVQYDADPAYQLLRRLDGLGVMSEIGDARWLAGDPVASVIWVGGTDPYSSTRDTTLYEHDLTTTQSFFHTQFTASSASADVDGLAVTRDGRVLFTMSNERGLYVYDPYASTDATTTVGVAAVSGRPKGISPVYAYGGSDYHLFGYSDGGGTLSLVEETSSSGMSGEGFAGGFRGGGAASRLAFFPPASATPRIFYASEEDGGVRAVDFGYWDEWFWVAPPTGPTTLMSIASDADGVYWTNRSTGIVSMVDPGTWNVIDLARSTSPFGVATDAFYVYWSDDVDQVIYYTPKPTF